MIEQEPKPEIDRHELFAGKLGRMSIAACNPETGEIIAHPDLHGLDNRESV